MHRLSYKLGKIKLNMDKSEPEFICIKTKSIVNVHRRVNKGSDMFVLVKFLKHRHLLRVLQFTVILLKYQGVLFVLLFCICLTTNHLLLL